MRPDGGRRSRPSSSALRGGRSCSSPHASAMPRASRRSASSRPRAPISSPWAIWCGLVRSPPRSGPLPRRSSRWRRWNDKGLAGLDARRNGLACGTCLGPGPDPDRSAGRASSGAETAQTVASSPGSGAAEPDLAYAAYDGGKYLTAFAEATRRVNEKGDPKAMALLGELYASGFGVPKDDQKAVAWYSLAVDRGDREAMFELAMLRLAGRGGPRDRDGAAALLERAAKLGHVAASYNLALLYLEGQQYERDFGKAAELLRSAADAGNPDAQYALATLYKEGRGVAKDLGEAMRLLGTAARAGNLDAEVEYAIALFNGTGIAKDEAGAVAWFRKAARQGSPIAQNRLARILAAGRGR